MRPRRRVGRVAAAVRAGLAAPASDPAWVAGLDAVASDPRYGGEGAG
ncbi:MAG TPA: hypothetical protein VH092_25765 [Urbifossiella sp.]|jgi:hypothetical protein|nr:hypothetical protein [Urbifossiella sp.]